MNGYIFINDDLIEEWKYHHASARKQIDGWYSKMQSKDWKSKNDFSTVWSSMSHMKAYQAEQYRLIFNIKGKQFRLICDISYGRKIITLKRFLTHAEYSKLGDLDGKEL